MFQRLAEDPRLTDTDWGIIFEDDAGFSTFALQAMAGVAAIQQYFRQSFAAATKLGFNMISYAGCCVGHCRCATPRELLPEAGTMSEEGLLPGWATDWHRHLGVMACSNGMACSHAYALTKGRAKVLLATIDTLTTGSQDCPRNMYGSSGCMHDPYVLGSYFSRCRGNKDEPAMNADTAPCRMLYFGLYVNKNGAYNNTGAMFPDMQSAFGVFYQVRKEFGHIKDLQ
jgi:hypothetical protein